MRARRTSAVDRSFELGTGFFALVVVVLVGVIAAVLWQRSRLSIDKFGFAFWRTSDWNPLLGEFGAFPFIWGTLYSSILALAIAAPISIGIAVFLSELCPNRLRRPLTFLTELLASIPSIVYGLWGIFVLIPAVRAVQLSLPESIRALPMFTGPAYGVSLFAAAVLLAIMIVPFTSSVAREVLKAVPGAQREAAYAMGATRWEATKVALYYARTGIVGAVMLGFGRALGETMAVTMVIGNRPVASASVFAPQYSMAAVVAAEFAEAVEDLHVSALVEVGLVLFVITLVVNAASRVLVWSMTRERRARVRPAPNAPPAQEASA
jgi:phosphate transport system permease protein